MNAGDAFRRQAGAHVWVIISEPQLDPVNVLAVNWTSVRNKHWEDLTCVLQAGDHPFIAHATLVHYAGAKVYANDDLDASLAAGNLQLLDPVSRPLLARIRAGAMNSPRLRIGYQQLLIQQGLAAADS